MNLIKQSSASFKGDSLNLQNVEANDAGRYWCEIRSASYKAIGEYGTDAKSVLLDVDDKKSELNEEFNCKGLSDGVYPDEKDCKKYYECAAHIIYHRECPISTVFYQDKNNLAIYGCYDLDQVPPPCGKKKQN